AGDLGTRTGNGVHDLARRGVDHLVVIGLEPDADLLSRHRSLSSFSRTPGGAASWFCFLETVPGWVRTAWLSTHLPTPAVGRVAVLAKRRPRSGSDPLWHPLVQRADRVSVPDLSGRCTTRSDRR